MHISIAVDVAIQLRNVVFALDILLMLRRIAKVLRNAALMLIGEVEEDEVKQKLYTKDYKEVNLMPEEIAVFILCS